MSITVEQAHTLVGNAVRRIVPDADLEHLSLDDDLRGTFELDSLDFLGFVEQLSQESGVRIDEDDYPALATMESATEFLQRRSS